jgi:DNA-binding MarR family transcriptional regulator
MIKYILYLLQQLLLQQMSILEEINQKEFKSNYDKAIVNLLFTNNWFRDLFKEVLTPHGLKAQHYNVLRILKGKSPASCSPGEIKKVMLDKSPDLTRLLDKMEKMQLIKRELCPENRRMMDIYITKDGEILLSKIMEKEEQLNSIRRKKITEQEAEQLSNLLDKFRA